MDGTLSLNIKSNKEIVESMFNNVNELEEVTFINIVTTSMGCIKCSNKNNLKLHMLEEEEGQKKELAYSYDITNRTLHDIKLMFQQAHIVNGNEHVKKFNLFSHSFYLGEVEMVRAKTGIVFKDEYFILTNVSCMEERFKHVLIKYEDFEYMFTQ